MSTKIIGHILLGTSLLGLIALVYINSPQSETTLVYSPLQMLNSLWYDYKNGYLDQTTHRTLDKDRQNSTTSEGQSYTMLRAVWMGDKQTFDEEWNWTKQNLSRPNDHLFSWMYQRQPDGSYGVSTANGDQNTASDADTDIAVALTFAYSRWQDPNYLDAARNIMQDIWNQEVISIGQNAYVAANNLEKNSNSATALVNPSYLNPAAYRIFAQVDTSHPWSKAVDGAYVLLSQTIAAPLDSPSTVGLPPDWVLVDKTTGAISSPTIAQATTNFSYDALRVPWHLALDWQWNKEPRAKDALSKFAFLQKTWDSQGKLLATYTHNGVVPSEYNYETPAMYGGTIGYFMVSAPHDAQNVYNKKLSALFTNDSNTWKQGLSYYDDNWAWFGIGLYNGLLPNLAAGMPPEILKSV